MRSNIKLPDGRKAVMMEYKMENFMRSCVDKYLDHCPDARLHMVDTPFLPEDQALSPQGVPLYDGPVTECLGCKHTFPGGSHTYENEKELEKQAKIRRAEDKIKLAAQKEKDQAVKGRLAPSAASIVMKILYGARFVCMELLRIVGFSRVQFHALGSHL